MLCSVLTASLDMLQRPQGVSVLAFMQVKRAVCTGLKSADTQVWNFQLPVQEDSAWAQVGQLTFSVCGPLCSCTAFEVLRCLALSLNLSTAMNKPASGGPAYHQQHQVLRADYQPVIPVCPCAGS